MKKLILTLTLCSLFGATLVSSHAADAPAAPAAPAAKAPEPPKKPEPTLEQRVAGLEAYIANTDPTAPLKVKVKKDGKEVEEVPKDLTTIAASNAGPGHNGFQMICTALVLFMTLPGLFLFYGGLVRSKNILSVLMQVMVGFSLIVVLWCLYGYSFAFTEGNAFIGGTGRLFMNGIFEPFSGTFPLAATFSKGVYIPEILFAAFQATFAGITCCLIEIGRAHV